MVGNLSLKTMCLNKKKFTTIIEFAFLPKLLSKFAFSFCIRYINHLFRCKNPINKLNMILASLFQSFNISLVIHTYVFINLYVLQYQLHISHRKNELYSNLNIKKMYLYDRSKIYKNTFSLIQQNFIDSQNLRYQTWYFKFLPLQVLM